MIDLTIVGAYFLVTFIIGAYYSRNISGIRDFAIAHKKYDTFILVATLSATLIGGGTAMGIAEKAFSVGVVYIIVISAAALNQLLVSHFIAPKTKKYYGMLSTGEIVKSMYGRAGQVFTGIAAVLISVGFAGAQVSAMGYIFTYFLGLPYYLGILIGCGVVVFYSTTGGIRSVVATDLFQFLILMIAIPMVCNVGLNYVGGAAELFAALPEKTLSFDLTLNEYVKYFFLFLTFLFLGSFYPSYIQRLLISRDIKQAIRATRINAYISFPSYIILGLIGFIVLVIKPDADANLALPYLVNTILPVGIKGFAVAGLLAIVMSTADSELNIAGISAVHDVINPLRKNPLCEQAELRWARIITVLLGALSIVLAIRFDHVIDIMVYSFVFWGPTVFVPLVFGMLGIIIEKRQFFIVIFSGTIIALTVEIWNRVASMPLEFDGIIPGMLANALVFVYFYLRNKKKVIFLNDCEVN